MRWFALPCFAILASFPRSAHADVTSWLSLGGGYSLEHSQVSRLTDRATVFTGTIGVGSSPISRFVVGGVFRTKTHFTLGTDLSLAARFATGGFARGDWGIAADLGLAARWWKSGDYGNFPLEPVLLAGAPWGLQLAIGVDVLDLGGGPHGVGAFAALELDLLRLTLMRQGSTDSIWKNLSPAGGRENP